MKTLNLNFNAKWLLVVAFAVMSAQQMWADPVSLPFSENFSSCSSTGGNDGSWSGSVGSGTPSITGWTFAGSTANASSCVKFGAGKNNGTTTHSATTPLLAKTSSVTLSFKAGSWDGDETSITVATTSGTITPATGGSNPFTASDASFSTYTFSITDITADFQITISSYGNKQRFFLDDVSVTAATPATTYTVYWLDNSSVKGSTYFATTASVAEGSTSYSCPSPAPTTASPNCGDKFMGWCAEAYKDSPAGHVFNDTEGTKPAINADTYFYAVFADEE